MDNNENQNEIQSKNEKQAQAHDQGFNHGFYAWTHPVDLAKKFNGDQDLADSYQRGFRAGYMAGQGYTPVSDLRQR